MDAITDLQQFDIYQSSSIPLSHYFKEHHGKIPGENDIKNLLPYARQTNFILETFRDIVDDLNYNKEKFENFIFTLDDDYEMLEDFISNLNNNIKSHHELIKISDQILTNLMLVQNDLEIRISKIENEKV